MAKKEMGYVSEYDYAVVNSDITKTAEEIIDIVDYYSGNN
jgi:guanylate kinase